MDLLEKYSLRFLTMRGANPLKSTITAKIVCTASVLTYIILIASLIYCIMFTITEIPDVVDNATGIAIAYEALVKEADILINHPRYVRVINCVNEFWTDDKFGMVAMKKVKDIRHITETFKFALPLTWINFCEIENKSCHILTYTAQSVCVTWIMMAILFYDTMSLILLASAYQELEQIKCGFLVLPINETTDEEDLDVLERVRMLVKQHNLVLVFIDGIGTLLSKTLVSQIVAIIITICASLFGLSSTGYPPSVSLVTTTVPYIAGALGENFIFCLAGQLIIEQSESVADAAYASKWWAKKQPNLRRAICLVTQRSQRSSQISAVGLLHLNLNTFVAIVKSTFSVLAFVNAVYE